LRTKRKIVEQFRALSPFASCADADLAALAALARVAHVREGEVVVREGRAGGHCFVIGKGRATVSLRGRRLDSLSAGDVFGDLWSEDAEFRPTTVTADVEMELYIFDARALTNLLAERPSMREAIWTDARRGA